MSTAHMESAEGADGSGRAERIRQVVAEIPAGRVATYGQVAALAGLPGGARQVGRALARLPEDTRLPWQRVVRASGASALAGASAERQLGRLQAEGVALANGKVVLKRCRWRPGEADESQEVSEHADERD